MRSAGLALSSGLAPTVAAIEASIVAANADRDAEERREALRFVEDVRERVGVKLSRHARTLSPDELQVLGMAFHEVAHAVVAVVCGDVVAYVALNAEDLSGIAPCFARATTSCGSIIAAIAVRLAGAEGFVRATGDAVGAYLSAECDRDDVAEILTTNGLTGEAAETAERIGMRIVDEVLSDRFAWRAIEDLAFRLLDEKRIDGEEVHRLVRVSARVHAHIAALVA